MDVKILGTGCASCQSMYNDVNRIIARNGWQGIQVEYVQDIHAHHVLRRDGDTCTDHQRKGCDDWSSRYDENRTCAAQRRCGMSITSNVIGPPSSVPLQVCR